MTSTCGLTDCARPTRDEAYVCDTCGDQFAADLKDLVDWLDEDLETSVSGTKGVQYRAGRTSGGGEAGLRVNWRAAELYRSLHRTLCDAVDHCLEVGTRNSSPTKGEPGRTIAAMAGWLQWRVDGLALDPAGPTHAGALAGLVERAKALVFWVPPERRFLGACELCGKDNQAGYVYAEGDADEAYCNRCEQAFPAEVRRQEMLAELDDRLMTAAEIARVSTYLGLQDNRDQVRRCIVTWHHRGRLAPSGDGDTARFRFGEVLPLLLERERRAG